MVTAIVQFPLASSVTRDKAAELFLGSAPKYRNLPGLIRKYYVYSAEQGTGGGVYLWKSRDDAERIYTPEWKQMIRERYGAEPVITYFDTPVVVDNLTAEITSDS
jgi:hypothetical protein